MSRPRAAASRYAAAGIPLLPLHTPSFRDGGVACSCEQPDCHSIGKHPRTKRGYQDATTDQAQIDRWWSQWPDANIGLVTGAALGVVLDVDREEALDELRDEHGITLPETRYQVTGSGGYHFFFALPDGETIGNGRGNLPQGIDVRGNGTGYVVAAPSLHASGTRYKWGGIDELALLPREVLALIQGAHGAERRQEPHQPSVGHRAQLSTADTVERARAWLVKRAPAVSGEGGHDHTFRTAVNVVRGFDLSEADAMTVLGEWNRTCQPPWSDAELLHKVREAESKGDMAWGCKLSDGRRVPAQSSLPEPPPPSDDDAPPPKRQKPKVFVTDDIRSMRQQAERALLARPDLEVYQRAGEPPQLVTLHRLAKPVTKQGIRRAKGTPILAEMKLSQLLECMSESAEWCTVKGDGEPAPTRPKAWIARTLLEHGAWDFRPLRAVVESPTMRPDGTIVDRPGYDRATALLYAPTPGVDFSAVPKRPTRDQALAAIDELKEVFCDFPFQHEHHRSVALAALITATIRPAIDGCTPLFAFDATTRGSGKGLLTDCVAAIAAGRSAPKMAPAENDEMRKTITAMLLAGDSMCVIDNVEGTLGGSALDVVITSETWSGRVLGTNDMARLSVSTVFFATGNNIRIRGDLGRRMLRAYLVPNCERPEERADFRHPRLLQWVKQERGRLVTAALTVVRAYVVSGCPDVGVKPMGSFEEWSRLVRQPLVWLDQPDPLASQDEVRASGDVAAVAFGEVLQRLRAIFGTEQFTTAELITRLTQGDCMTDAADDVSELETALQELAPKRHGSWYARTIGAVFRKYQGRIFGDLRLAGGPRVGRGVRWSVEQVIQDGS